MPRLQQPEPFYAGIKLFVVSLFVVVAAGAAWSYWGHHFWTSLQGPTEITLADIAKMNDPAELPSTWVKVKFDNGVMSEVVLEETNAGVSRIDERYLIFEAGDRWMIASVPDGFEGNELSGQIYRENAGMFRNACAAVADELKEVHHGKLYPCEFIAGEDYGQSWKMFPVVIGMFAGFGAILGFCGLGGMLQGFRAPDPAALSAGEEADEESQHYSGMADAAMARILREQR